MLIDGVELGTIHVPGWRARVSAGFQDFGHFELVARESIGIGDLERCDDEAAVRALDRAGAADLVETLPEGLDSLLGTTFGGTNLSGGQWQKVALARALMREAPLLLVLDELAAALDPDAEFRLFERYAAAARTAGSATGTVTLLVTHRFSTVRMADIIVVLDRGRVSEMGSHTELVRHGGLYAELYHLQAESYR